ncbi:predicted protein [Plenodomus lingam JN3]|uniref:Predicted protein n=1 Tax=Leptosphaeria maculans (strain JN3 / isolate v23.1.3 / race Av1-4-5-6-7-8) TaxID=985895 RepID=E4ZYT3_LEPMJ|nr:predicted protein [Plenodomus lingam JN3]CBX96609.1 predicted protein [Plenodomus lingam JN3]
MRWNFLYGDLGIAKFEASPNYPGTRRLESEPLAKIGENNLKRAVSEMRYEYNFSSAANILCEE